MKIVLDFVTNSSEDDYYYEEPEEKQSKSKRKRGSSDPQYKDYFYISHCWRCGHSIDGGVNRYCTICGHYICPECGACFCRSKHYYNRDLHSTPTYFDSYLADLNKYIKKPTTQTKLNSNSPKTQPASTNAGCYIATAVYGSYNCPEVWVLRRFRDRYLAQIWPGKVFIKVYYAISPWLVKKHGKKKWFTTFWKKTLDKLVYRLKKKGVEDTEYND